MERVFYFLAGALLAAGICRLIGLRRENRLMDSLREMLDKAINGEFQPERLDESKLSAVENSFKQFLDNSLVTGQNQSRQKETIQSLISDISHQTVTPLANIRLYLELLEERLEERAPELEAVKEQSEKLDFLIQSLGKLSRMETGILAFRVQEHGLEQVLDALRIQFASKAEEKGLGLAFFPTRAEARFDLKWTIEAVGNIVDNAVKYTPPGGNISVRVQSYPFFARIDVKDSGIGIEQKDLGNIFGRFYRAGQVGEEPGVGIGLYLAREIIQGQKGYIKVSSRLGEGSVFSVFLPRGNVWENVSEL